MVTSRSSQRADAGHVPAGLRVFNTLLMARLAGLRLKERWGGWDHEPFTAVSSLHVSVFGR